MRNRYRSVPSRRFRRSVILGLFLLIVVASGATAQTFERDLVVMRPRIFGPDVTALQERLFSLGYTDVGPIDGYFGPMTAGAVAAFRDRNGIPPSDAVTRELWDRIFSDDATAHENGPRALPIILAEGRQLYGAWWRDGYYKWIGAEDIVQSLIPGLPRAQRFTARGFRGATFVGYVEGAFDPLHFHPSYWTAPTVTITHSPPGGPIEWLVGGEHDPLIGAFRPARLDEYRSVAVPAVQQWLDNLRYDIPIGATSVYELDYDGDGNDDVLVESTNFHALFEPPESGVYSVVLVLMNTGDGWSDPTVINSFADHTDSPGYYPSLSRFETVLDANGDGWLEIVMSHRQISGSFRSMISQPNERGVHTLGIGAGS